MNISGNPRKGKDGQHRVTQLVVGLRMKQTQKQENWLGNSINNTLTRKLWYIKTKKKKEVFIEIWQT